MYQTSDLLEYQEPAFESRVISNMYQTIAEDAEAAKKFESRVISNMYQTVTYTFRC